MKIVVVGTGYVGLVSGSCFAEMGVTVTCVDVDRDKISRIESGNIPIYEPGLDELVERNVRDGRLFFSTDLQAAMKDAEIIFIAVGTPQDEDGSADMKYVMQVAREIGGYLDHYVLVVTKSTVPVGSSEKVRAQIEEALVERGADVCFDVASNPEFLKEGSAVKDFMSPDRVVVGVDSERARQLMTTLYRPFLPMLATRISFMNDIANLCELVGADVNMVRKGIGADTRIGSKFLYPGCGYGGSCFPKDIKALIHTAEQKGYEMSVLKAVDYVNDRQKEVLFRKLVRYYGTDLSGKRVAIWGLSFKPETDDMREATSLVTINLLLEAGCDVVVYDPVAMDECRRRIGDSVEYSNDKYEAVTDADALLVITEWRQFRLPNWKLVYNAMRVPLVIDGRNIYDPDELGSAGIKYYCIGR